MLTIDGKEYDEKKMSDKGRIAFAQLQQIARRQVSLNLELQNMIILKNHHEAILKKEMPKKEK